MPDAYPPAAIKYWTPGRISAPHEQRAHRRIVPIRRTQKHFGGIMYRIIELLVLALIIALALLSEGAAQNLLSGPESVSFDSIYNRYLVSNTNDGAIVAIDSDGAQSYFQTGLGMCLSNHIRGTVLYVSSGGAGSMLVGIDLATGQTVVTKTLPLPVRNYDGITSDTSGNL
jgi:hypothetical protein